MRYTINQIIHRMMHNHFISWIAILLFCIMCFVDCREKIKLENKVGIMAKILRPSIAKNGAKTFAYFYKGKKYLDSFTFDARYFSYGDKFLIFIDKSNPELWNMPRPINERHSLKDSLKFLQEGPMKFYVDSIDLSRLDSIEP
jgi:hypothetical protein